MPEEYSFSDKLLLACGALKTADLCNTARPFSVHNVAVDRLLEEYQHQGETEESLGYPLHPMHTLSSENKPKDQISFFEIFIVTFYEEMKSISTRPMHTICLYLKNNLSIWKEKSAQKS